jgi:nitrate/nitrite-specific signal transduction histidine kinase
MTDFNRVVFNAGEPIDTNKLNQLQANLNILYTDNAALKQTSNQTVSGLEGITKQIPVIPVIDTGRVNCKINGNSEIVHFSNASFSVTPNLIATISSNLDTTTSYSIRATAESTTQGRIEVVSTDTKKNNDPILVSWIAVQMKEVVSN